MQNVTAIRFRYKHGFGEGNFESLSFYAETLRGFLKRHMGKSVWLKGGVIEQPAYLIFDSSLKDETVRMLSKQLEHGGFYTIEPVQKPSEIIKKYIGKERVAVGYLNLGATVLGNPETLHEPSQEEVQLLKKIREGFMLNDYIFIKADDCEIKMVPRKEYHETVEKPMAILTNYTEMWLKNGKILSVEKHGKFGLWLEALNG